MKTKKLIELLNECDPTGELDVCVGNVDILYVDCLPAYYDGSLQVLERDYNGRFFNVTGAKYKRSGQKVNLVTLSISDLVYDFPEMPVDYSELSEKDAERTKQNHEKLRKLAVDSSNQLEREYFVEWAKEKAANITQDLEDIKDVAEYFFENHNIQASESLTVPLGKSYVQARGEQWNEKYEVYSNEGFLEIREI